MCGRVSVRMRVCIHTYIYIYIYIVCMYVCIYARAHECMYASTKFSRRSARERDFRKSRSRLSAQKLDVVQNFQDAPHGSAIFIEILRPLRTPHRSAISLKFSRRSARERDFDHKRTMWSESVWYRTSIEIFLSKILSLTMNPVNLYQAYTKT